MKSKDPKLSEVERALIRPKDTQGPPDTRGAAERRKSWRVRSSQSCMSLAVPWDYSLLDSSGSVCVKMGQLHPDNIVIFTHIHPKIRHYFAVCALYCSLMWSRFFGQVIKVDVGLDADTSVCSLAFLSPYGYAAHGLVFPSPANIEAE